MIVEIPMPYIGSCLSVNHYKVGKYYTRRETAEWMLALQAQARYHLRNSVVKFPPIIHLSGIFKNLNNCPDMSNLTKVVFDSLELVFKTNDRDYKLIDEGYTIDKSKDPMLVIGIEVEDAI